MKKCENPECVSHVVEAHLPNCQKTGVNRCQDYLHNATCLSKQDTKAILTWCEKLLNEK